ncbi:HipA N-terminal domain-containing protein [Aquirufa sp. A-Brett2-15D]|jgi:HipA-like protein
MRKATILYKSEPAGILSQLDNGSFHFSYLETWLDDEIKPAISLTMPKKKKEFKSPHLFPLFFHLLPEGANKQAVCKFKKIDPSDHFGILLNTARFDTIGAITLEQINA